MSRRKPKKVRRRLKANCSILRKTAWSRMSPRKRAACVRLCKRNATMGQLIDAGC